MESLIFEVLKSLKILYIVHIIILVLILVFNFITLSQIIWLKKIFSKLYFYATITSPILFIFLKKLFSFTSWVARAKSIIDAPAKNTEAKDS